MQVPESQENYSISLLSPCPSGTCTKCKLFTSISEVSCNVSFVVGRSPGSTVYATGCEMDNWLRLQ